MRRGFALMILVGLACRSAPAAAPPPLASPGPVAIALRPAAEPRPALLYRLVPESAGLIRGNAAVFYHRAILLMTQQRASIADRRRAEGKDSGIPTEDQTYAWLEGPIAAIPLEKARQAIAAYQSAYNEIEQGSKRSSCDWEYDARPEGIMLLIPEIQEMRALARLASLRARVAIREGKTAEAVRWIGVGIVMGRHVGEGPTLIQGLVGIAIESIMARSLEELIQAPGTPSLYWAFANRPRPLVDFGPGFEGERTLLEKEIPGLRDLDRGVWGLDQARRFADTLQEKLILIASGQGIPGTNLVVPERLAEDARRLGIAAALASSYTPARRALIESGRDEAEVDAMPVVQVVALHAYRMAVINRDDQHKWRGVPYWQSFDRSAAVSSRGMAEAKGDPLFALFSIVASPLDSIRLAGVRSERQYDALQCIEAIRLHAHRKGSLPDSLDALADAPAPLDPATGKPFAYRRDGDTATLSAPLPPGSPDHPSYRLEYVLTLTR